MYKLDPTEFPAIVKSNYIAQLQWAVRSECYDLVQLLLDQDDKEGTYIHWLCNHAYRKLGKAHILTQTWVEQYRKKFVIENKLKKNERHQNFPDVNPPSVANFIVSNMQDEEEGFPYRELSRHS